MSVNFRENNVPKDVWGRLQSEVTFKCPSDAKLASLYLENAKAFPIDMLSKFFDIILDPTFKLEDVSFKTYDDVFQYVSEHRAKVAAAVGKENQDTPASTANKRVTRSQAKTSPSVLFPGPIVGQVVECMLQDRLPLGVAAMESLWGDAYSTNVADFHAMSLVHRSWTPFTRKGFRRRAVVPFNQMQNFLLSPLCNPSITELIIYWDVRVRREEVTSSDMALFEALLRRLPNVHSLAFNTCHVWRKGDLNHWNWNASGDQPPLRVGECLELIADLLPNLENLWLKNYRGEIETETVIKHIDHIWLERTMQLCPEMSTLYRVLPKMKSLKFLSMCRWTCKGPVDWQLTPPASLKTVELSVLDKNMTNLKWLLEPRGEYKPTTLSVDVRDYALKNEDIAGVGPGMEKLQIYATRSWLCSTVLQNCRNLKRLDLLVSSSTYEDTLVGISIPESLQYLSIHFDDENCRYEALRNALASSRLINIIDKHLGTLPRLDTLILSESKRIPLTRPVEGELDGFLFYMDVPADELKKRVPEKLSKICEEKAVKLDIRYASCTPVCDRHFNRYGDEPDSEPDPNKQYESDPLGLNPTKSGFGSFFGKEGSMAIASMLVARQLNKDKGGRLF